MPKLVDNDQVFKSTQFQTKKKSEAKIAGDAEKALEVLDICDALDLVAMLGLEEFHKEV